MLCDEFPDDVGEAIEIQSDGTVLVNMDPMGFKFVPLSSCVDADLVISFTSAMHSGASMDLLDVEETRKGHRQANVGSHYCTRHGWSADRICARCGTKRLEAAHAKKAAKGRYK